MVALRWASNAADVWKQEAVTWTTNASAWTTGASEWAADGGWFARWGLDSATITSGTTTAITSNITAASITASPLYSNYTRPATIDATAANDAAWQILNSAAYDQIIQQWNVITHETQEQRAARMLQIARYEDEQRTTAAERQQRMAAQHAEHARVNARAEALLLEHLSEQQNEELRARGHFHLETIAPSGERRRYRIRRGRHGNIDQVDAQGKVLKSLCVHPTMGIPDADTMLAQKLWLQHNEPELLRVANHIPRR